MKKIELSEEELETMNYNDIAHLVLETNGKKMKIIDLFHEVGKILNLPESSYEEHITDFFELLSTDKRFVMLDDGYWDLSIKHSKGMIIDSDDEEFEDDEILNEEDNQDDWHEDEDIEDSDDDVDDDDLSDLVIIDDSDEENNM